MRTRELGQGGPEVSVVGLGTNNFGARCDYEQTRRGDRRGARARDHALRHRRHLRAGHERGLHRPRARGAPRPRPARDEVRQADGRAARRLARLARLHPLGRRGLAAAAAHRRDRRLPDARARPVDADRGDARRAARARAGGQRCATSARRNYSAAQIEEADRVARERGAHALRRRRRTTTRSSSARSRTRCCRCASGSASGMLPFFPLASGLLTGKYTRGVEATEGRLAGREVPEERWDRLERLQRVRRRARRAAALGRDRRPRRDAGGRVGDRGRDEAGAGRGERRAPASGCRAPTTSRRSKQLR